MNLKWFSWKFEPFIKIFAICEQWPPIAHNRWCLGLARSVTCLCWANIGFIRGNRAFCLISYEIFGWLHTLLHWLRVLVSLSTSMCHTIHAEPNYFFGCTDLLMCHSLPNSSVSKTFLRNRLTPNLLKSLIPNST